MIRHHESSAALCRYVAEQTGDAVVLSFSAGKDAVASWLQLRRYFKRIVPFYYYLIPDLEFVDEGLRYYEDFFETKIERYPSPQLFRMLRSFVFQPPERCETIERLHLPKFDHQMIENDMRERFEMSDALCAMGTRATDSMARRTALRRYGSLNPNRRTFWPVYDWTSADLAREFTEAKVRLVVDYEMCGRSFDGLQHLFTGPIKQRFPRDYERIREWFPMIDLESFRRNLDPENRA